MRFESFLCPAADTGKVEDNRQNLRRHGHDDQTHRVEVIQGTQQPTAQEPGDTEAGFKDAKAGASHGFGNDLADGGLHDAVLRAHADSPKDNSDDHARRIVRQENEAGKEGAAQGRQNHGFQPDLIKQPAEEQGGKGINRHSQCVQQAQGCCGESGSLCGVEGNHGKVRKAEGIAADRRHVEHEGLLKVKLLVFLLDFLEHLRVRIFDFGEHHQSDGDERRNAQKSETNPVGRKQVAGAFDEADDKQNDRAEERPQLVKELLIGEALSSADLAGGKADQRILCRFFDGFADAFQNHQTAGQHPAVLRDQRQRRDCKHLKSVPHDHQRPVFLCLIRKEPGQEPQGIAAQLSHAGDKPDGCRRRAGKVQVFPQHAPRALVGHIGEQADNAHQGDECHRAGNQRAFLRFHVLRFFLFSPSR